jgi:hypothetical protein
MGRTWLKSLPRFHAAWKRFVIAKGGACTGYTPIIAGGKADFRDLNECFDRPEADFATAR